MTPRGSGLAPLEIASGIVFGVVADVAAVGETPDQTPLEALERAVLPALRRPPCLVSFSGGRDSSAILAVAARVARRESLPLPIPATNRFASVGESDESDWQERVVDHLGLEDWARVEHDAELDCVGPIAAQTLLRHGLLWPFNAHFHVPLLRLASGGSMLTGIGGDEMLSVSSWTRVLDVLRARVRPEPRDLLRVGFVVAPESLRRRVLRSRLPLAYPWLRPEARRDAAAAWAAQSAMEPLRWRAHVGWVRRLRYLHVGVASLRAVAADERVRIEHPFLDPSFASRLAHLRRRGRFENRTSGMVSLFGGLLPDDVLSRSTKASFDAAFWNEPSRTFAASWQGEGVDTELVDVEALRAEWSSDAPDPRSFTLAQAAWLARQTASGDGVEQAVDGVRQ